MSEIARPPSIVTQQSRHQDLTMAWETRERCGKLLYYRTHRRGPGNKRVRVYFGAGPIAELAAVTDLVRRLEDEIPRRKSAAG